MWAACLFKAKTPQYFVFSLLGAGGCRWVLGAPKAVQRFTGRDASCKPLELTRSLKHVMIIMTLTVILTDRRM